MEQQIEIQDKYISMPKGKYFWYYQAYIHLYLSITLHFLLHLHLNKGADRPGSNKLFLNIIYLLMKIFI